MVENVNLCGNPERIPSRLSLTFKTQGDPTDVNVLDPVEYTRGISPSIFILNPKSPFVISNSSIERYFSITFPIDLICPFVSSSYVSAISDNSASNSTDTGFPAIAFRRSLLLIDVSIWSALHPINIIDVILKTKNDFKYIFIFKTPLQIPTHPRLPRNTARVRHRMTVRRFIRESMAENVGDGESECQ